MITRAYIDGFNLYYGKLKEHRLHWLDLAELSRRLGGGFRADKVIYCTARVSDTSHDPTKSKRQDVYLRALSSYCSNIEIIEGEFRSQYKWQPVAACKKISPSCSIRASVWTEKGSDVNLASRLIHDAHLRNFDRALVISGDSDLVEPIRLVTSEIKREVWVFNPRSIQSKELQGVATKYAVIKAKTIANSQLPDEVQAGSKIYRKPIEWTNTPPKMVKRITHRSACAECQCAIETRRFKQV